MVAIRPVSLAILMLALLPASAAANSTSRIIVKREAGLSAAERRDIRADADVRLVDTLSLPRTEVVAAESDDLGDALRDLNADPDVVYAERDRLRAVVADPGLSVLWGLRNTGQSITGLGLGLYDADVDGVEAWAQTTAGGVSVTGTGQTVAVVDSGVDASHEDLAGKVSQSYDFIEDANGEVGGADLNSHGTHVAGTIAATRNTKGIAGVAPGAQIMSLRVADARGLAWDSDIAEAFEFAATRGVKVVNASLADVGESETLETAIGLHPQTLYVVAAGNGDTDHVGDDNDATPVMPCNAPSNNVICVGASTNRDEPATFSNFGDENVDLFAPGQSVLSTIPLGIVKGFETQKYLFKSGTSMASPHVAATAALLLQADPTLSIDAVKALIMSTAEPEPALAGLSVTGARLNAGLAVAHALAVGGSLADTGDGDGTPDAVDECPTEIGAAGAAGCPDEDDDAFPDAVDNCVAEANPDQADLDKDEVGDVCDDDRDGDGVDDAEDNCDDDVNANQADLDDDHVGDVCDTTPRGHDNDGDGRLQVDDACPNVHGTLPNGCPAPPPSPPTVPPPPSPPAYTPPDSDGDGRPDPDDACSGQYAATANGCPVAQVASLSAKAKKRGKKRSATVKVYATGVATIRITVERKKGRRWVRVKRRTVAGTRATVRLSRLKRGTHRVRISISSSGGRGSAVSKQFRVR